MDTLPLDVLLDILVHLPLQAILVLRRTCKSFYTVTHAHALWALLFRTHVLDQHIPHPDVDSLADLSAHHLESLTRRALALRRTWTSPQPAPLRQITLTTPTEPRARVIFLQFLPGRSNRWLISVRMTTRPRAYLLQCWDVASEHPKCVAELTHADGPYGGVVLNSDPTSPAVLAMQSAQTETFSIRFDAQEPEYGFETEATIDGIRELHHLAGNTLVTRQTDVGSALCLWDLADLRQEKLQLLNPSLVEPDDRIQAIHLAHDYALIVRVQSIEIYSTIPRPSLLSHRGAPVAYPLSQFKFQWRTDTVVLCPQHVSESASSPWQPPPIHLLVRFGSIYPWPVNVLHHYRLLPNPMYPTAHLRRRTPTTPSSGGPTTPTSPRIHSPMGALPRPVTTEYNLPYDPRPQTTHTIASPVRLFGQSAMALGQYGTALWLDNHTDAWLGTSDRGQRLAGRVVSAHCGKEDPGANVYASVDECGMDTDPSTEGDPTAISDGASMLFGVHADDAWTRVAMEEEAGRIALGHVDGAITLLEY